MSFIGKPVFSWNLLSTLQKKRIRGNGIDKGAKKFTGKLTINAKPLFQLFLFSFVKY